MAGKIRGRLVETLHLVPLPLLVEAEAFLLEHQPLAEMAVLVVAAVGVALAVLVTRLLLPHLKATMAVEAPGQVVLAPLAAVAAHQQRAKVGQIVQPPMALAALERRQAFLVRLLLTLVVAEQEAHLLARLLAALVALVVVAMVEVKQIRQPFKMEPLIQAAVVVVVVSTPQDMPVVLAARAS